MIDASGGVQCKGCGVIVISVPAHEDGLCSVCIREELASARALTETWRKLALKAYEAWEAHSDLFRVTEWNARRLLFDLSGVLRPTMLVMQKQLAMDVKERAPRSHDESSG